MKIKNLVVTFLLALIPPAALAQVQTAPVLHYMTDSTKLYALAIDETPSVQAFVGWCPECAGHALIGPAHDIFVLTRNDTPAAHLGAAWAYAPGTAGTLATGGAVVVKAGVNFGAAAQAALANLPAAADALGAAGPFVVAGADAVTIDAFWGPRLGDASGIPKDPYGISATLGIPFSPSALASFFGK